MEHEQGELMIQSLSHLLDHGVAVVSQLCQNFVDFDPLSFEPQLVPEHEARVQQCCCNAIIA
jgi:hypothetical protein